MKVAVFVIDGILNSVDKKMDNMLTQLYYQWIVMYIMSRDDNHTKISLQEFKVIKYMNFIYTVYINFFFF